MDMMYIIAKGRLLALDAGIQYFTSLNKKILEIIFPHSIELPFDKYIELTDMRSETGWKLDLRVGKLDYP